MLTSFPAVKLVPSVLEKGSAKTNVWRGNANRGGARATMPPLSSAAGGSGHDGPPAMLSPSLSCIVPSTVLDTALDTAVAAEVFCPWSREENEQPDSSSMEVDGHERTTSWARCFSPHSSCSLENKALRVSERKS